MQTRNKWWLAGLLLGGAALLAWAFAPRPVLVELAQASTGRFEAGDGAHDHAGLLRVRKHRCTGSETTDVPA